MLFYFFKLFLISCSLICIIIMIIIIIIIIIIILIIIIIILFPAVSSGNTFQQLLFVSYSSIFLRSHVRHVNTSSQKSLTDKSGSKHFHHFFVRIVYFIFQ